MNNGQSEPLISIITVVFRARNDLPDLLRSVFQLKDTNTEFIVIDGGSDDGTRELLTQCESQIDHWVSEPDQGIYDAMNKGISVARGTFIYHLNAGDRLLYLPVKELREAAANLVDVAAFRVSVDGEYEFRPARGFVLSLNNTLHHQGTFFRREGFPRYDTRFKIFADFDVNQRLALRGAKIELFEQVVALHASGGVSHTRSDATIAEFFAVIKKNYGWSHLPLAKVHSKWRGLMEKSKRLASIYR